MQGVSAGLLQDNGKFPASANVMPSSPAPPSTALKRTLTGKSLPDFDFIACIISTRKRLLFSILA